MGGFPKYEGCNAPQAASSKFRAAKEFSRASEYGPRGLFSYIFFENVHRFPFYSRFLSLSPSFSPWFPIPLSYFTPSHAMLTPSQRLLLEEEEAKKVFYERLWRGRDLFKKKKKRPCTKGPRYTAVLLNVSTSRFRASSCLPLLWEPMGSRDVVGAIKQLTQQSGKLKGWMRGG